MTMQKVCAVLAFGLAAAGCGGQERAGELQTKPDAKVAAREGKLLVNPHLNPALSPFRLAPGERSALAFDIQDFEVVFVCDRVDGEDYCEDVRGYDDTYYNWTGTVGVWTYEYGTASSYFTTFASSSVSQDQVQPVYDTNNVQVGMFRHYTLQSVTAGTFDSQVTSAFNNQVWSDFVYIY